MKILTLPRKREILLLLAISGLIAFVLMKLNATYLTLTDFTNVHLLNKWLLQTLGITLLFSPAIYFYRYIRHPKISHDQKIQLIYTTWMNYLLACALFLLPFAIQALQIAEMNLQCHCWAILLVPISTIWLTVAWIGGKYFWGNLKGAGRKSVAKH